MSDKNNENNKKNPSGPPRDDLYTKPGLRQEKKKITITNTFMTPKYLVEGALVECNQGTNTCFVLLPENHGVFTKGDGPLLNKLDCEVPENIEGFGQCLLSGENCVPDLDEWENPNESTDVDGEPSITMDSTVLCKKGGLVKPLMSGQDYVDMLDMIKGFPHLATLMLLTKYGAGIFNGKLPGCFYCGDPINTATGNFAHETKDLVIPGAIPLDFSRFYNANDDTKGILGYGWTHTYNIVLNNHDDAITIDFEDGQREVYAKTGKKMFTPVLDYRKELKQTKSGYTLATHTNDIYEFDFDGHFLSKTDINNNTVKLSYDNGLLKKVESDSGYFTFSYSSNGLLTMLEDHTGRKAELIYENDMLIRVLRLIDAEIKYEYDENKKLISIQNSLGNYIQNDYDEDGRVTKQNFVDGGTISNQYDDQARCTTTTERNGNVTKYYRDDSFRTEKVEHDDNSVEYFEYNKQNLRTSHTDRNGNISQYEYDSKGNLTRIINPLGYVTETRYNSLNKPLSVRQADGSLAFFSYDDKGNLVSSTDPLGHVTKCTRNTQGAVKQLVLPDGSASKITYDGKGNIIEVDRFNQSKIKYEYDEINRVVATIDGNGNRTTYEYNERGDITKAKNADGFERLYEYNVTGKVTKIIDFDGSVLASEYNCLGKPIKFIDQEGNETNLEYDLMWNVSKRIDASGNATVFEYNKLNRLETVTNAKGSQIRYEYDPNGNETKVIGPRGEETILSYDPMNRVKEVIEPDGAKTNIEYDAMGRIIKTVDPLGFERKFAYDQTGQKISEIDPTNRKLSFSYTALGQISEMIDSANRKTKYEYLPGGLLEKVMYPDGTSIAYDYDADMNVISQTSQDGFTVYYEYNCLNQITRIYSDKGEDYTYTYDAVGKITGTTDANGNTTKYVYSPAGHLISVIDPMGNKSEYDYDKMGNLIEIKQFAELNKAKQLNQQNSELCVTKYMYDSLGQVEKTIDALGKTEAYTYDEAGNVLSKLDKDGYLTQYSYDTTSHLEEIRYGDGKSVKLSYNLLRQLTEIRDWLGITTIEVDEVGRANNVTDHNGRSVEYAYGSEGERKSIQYPDGKMVEYQYDEALRLKALIDGEHRVDYSYDTNSRLSDKLFSNGMNTKYLYNDMGHLGELTHSDNEGILDRYNYTYDNMANKTGIKKFRRGLREESGSYQYTYDALSRLTGVSKDGRTIKTFGYDVLGNRSLMVDKDARTEYTYNPLNQLMHMQSASGSLDFSYDARGNLTQVLENGKLRNAYEFSPCNRLAKATNAVGQVASYEYNGLGFRVEKRITDGTNPTRNIDYVLDLTKQYHNLLQMTDDTGTQSYTWDNFDVVGLSDNTGSHFYMQDELGSPLRYMDASGNLADTYGNDGFGNSLYNNDTYQPFGFTGYQYDNVAQTYFAQAREYDPLTGRFTSVDAVKGFINEPITMHPYCYCWDNPIRNIDPDGIFPQERLDEAHVGLQGIVKMIYGENAEVEYRVTGYPYSDTGKGKVDIIIKTPAGWEVYEIKPEWERDKIEKYGRLPYDRLQGPAQRQGYITALGSMKKPVIKSATTFNPNGWTVPSYLNPTQKIRYYTYPGETGMIYWGYVSNGNPDKVPVPAWSLEEYEKLMKKFKKPEPELALQPTTSNGLTFWDYLLLGAIGAWAVLSPDPVGEGVFILKCAEMF